MTLIRELEPRCEWRARDVADPELWIEHLDEQELRELDDALAGVRHLLGDLLRVTPHNFPLPRLSKRLAAVGRSLVEGRGYSLLRGIQRDRYTQQEMSLLFWGVGMHLGRPLAQNHHGHLLGDVTDMGKSPDDPTSRGNELGRIRLGFHSDASDFVGLMSLCGPAWGGLSSIANAVAIHNHIVRTEPRLAAELYKPQPLDFRGEQAPGEPGWYLMPVFTVMNGRLFVRFIKPYILDSQRHEDAPRLTASTIEGLHLIERLADSGEFSVDMEFQPGDMQFINNYHVLHDRTEYEDDPATGRVRHLKRLWLESDFMERRPTYFRNTMGRHWADRPSISEHAIAAL